MLKLKAEKVEQGTLIAQVEVDWKNFEGESRKIMNAILKTLGIEVASCLQMRSVRETNATTVVDIKGKNYSIRFVRTNAGLDVFKVTYIVAVDHINPATAQFDWATFEQLH